MDNILCQQYPSSCELYALSKFTLIGKIYACTENLWLSRKLSYLISIFLRMQAA